MNPDPSTPASFQDPELRAAIRQAWGRERAPAELMQRVKAALASEGLLTTNTAHDIHPTPRPFWRRPAFGYGAAAAAAVVIGIGLATAERIRAKPPAMVAASVVATVPANLANALVRTHDGCLRLHPADHHLFAAAPKNDFAAIAKAMSAKLHHPVLATAMGHDWEFHGAAICPVGDMKSAHLVYLRSDAAISVFSLPASAALSGCPDHQNCDAALNGHPIAGFVESGGFFCVVASSGGKSPIDAQQVKAMRDQLHGDLLAAAASEHAHESFVASMAR